MASYQSPGRSLVALLRMQFEGVGEEVLSREARRCLVSYARHLERKELDRSGDHLAAGLLLNAAELVAYIPAGKLGKGSVELTRLQERVERTQTAVRRAGKRERRATEARGTEGRPVPRASWADDPNDETIDDDLAEAADAGA